jgi:hypothetical protein
LFCFQKCALDLETFRLITMLSYCNLKVSFIMFQIALCLIDIFKNCAPFVFKMTSQVSKSTFANAYLRFDAPKTESLNSVKSVFCLRWSYVRFCCWTPYTITSYTTVHTWCLRYPSLQSRPTQPRCLRLFCLRPRSAPVILSSRTQLTSSYQPNVTRSLTEDCVHRHHVLSNLLLHFSILTQCMLLSRAIPYTRPYVNETTSANFLQRKFPVYSLIPRSTNNWMTSFNNAYGPNRTSWTCSAIEQQMGRR